MYWSGLFAGYAALNVLFTTWARTALSMSRQLSCGRRSINLLSISVLTSIIGIAIFATITVIRPLDGMYYLLNKAMFPLYGLLVFICIVQCSVFIVAGAMLLSSSRHLSNAAGGSKSVVSRKVRCALVFCLPPP